MKLIKGKFGFFKYKADIYTHHDDVCDDVYPPSYTKRNENAPDDCFVIYDEAVDALRGGHCVFIVVKSRSKKRYTLRFCPPKKTGESVYDIETRSIEYRRHDIGKYCVYSWENYCDYIPDEFTCYVRTLQGDSILEAKDNAQKLLKEWGYDPKFLYLDPEDSDMFCKVHRNCPELDNWWDSL